MARTSPQVVTLGSSQTVRDTASLVEKLNAAMSGMAPIVIDGTGLVDADVATLQVLIAAFRTATAKDRRITFKSPEKGSFTAMLTQAGLVGADGRPVGAEGAFLCGQRSTGQ